MVKWRREPHKRRPRRSFLGRQSLLRIPILVRGTLGRSCRKGHLAVGFLQGQLLFLLHPLKFLKLLELPLLKFLQLPSLLEPFARIFSTG